ncbi:transposase [Roseateles sp. NT4]|uniref:transposase n=1 Tax=Roseateles sp. NT4 TaxID=3453715 RepID=UPI003EEF0447
MSTSALPPSEVFVSESAAVAYVQARVWPHGPICAHCGAINQARKAGAAVEHREEYRCGSCGLGFTLRDGTIFAGNQLELSVWLKAMALSLNEDVVAAEAWLAQRLGLSKRLAAVVMEGVRGAVRGRDLAAMEFRTGPYKVQAFGHIIDADTLEESRALEDEVVARALSASPLVNQHVSEAFERGVEVFRRGQLLH